MKVHFLGTSASEGFPNMYCSCLSCKKAKDLGGHNIRTRSSVIIDDHLKIDYPPDTHMQALRDGVNLGLVEHLLITHTHYDHLYAGDLKSRRKGFAHGVTYPLHIHGNSLAIDRCKQESLDQISEGEAYHLHLLHPFKSYKIGDANVTPLLADHAPHEVCLLFYIEKNGKALLYGNDTGWFPDETWAWLKDKQIDLAILDCTVGQNGNKRNRNHMSVETIIEVQSVFKQNDNLTANGKVIATHFSHNAHMLHDDFVAVFEPHDIAVAYDGLVVTL